MTDKPVTPEEAIDCGIGVVERAERALEALRRDDPTELEGIGYYEENLAIGLELLRLARLGAEVEGWEREWGVRDIYGCIDEASDRGRAAAEDSCVLPGDRVVSRRVSPWEKVEEGGS